MSVSTQHDRAESPAGCRIAGHALVEAPLSEIAALRDRPGPPGAPALPPRFLRHADEHTVVGMHAVLRVLADRGAGPVDVARHAVVSASCQIGRLAAAKTLANLATGGGLSVSPHVVPQCSLHAVAGAVSVGLGMHGPLFGVGGGSEAFTEGLFAAATLVQAAAAADGPPCVWLVATEWAAEPELDSTGAAVGDPVCRGLALAIERAAASADGTLRLAVHAADVPRLRIAGPKEGRGLAEFARAIEMCREGTALVSWSVACTWGAEIRVTRDQRPAAHGAKAARMRGAA